MTASAGHSSAAPPSKPHLPICARRFELRASPATSPHRQLHRTLGSFSAANGNPACKRGRTRPEVPKRKSGGIFTSTPL